MGKQEKEGKEDCNEKGRSKRVDSSFFTCTVLLEASRKCFKVNAMLVELVGLSRSVITSIKEFSVIPILVNSLTFAKEHISSSGCWS